MVGVVTGLVIGVDGLAGFVDGIVAGVMGGTVNGVAAGFVGVVVTGLVAGTVMMVGVGLSGGLVTGVVDIGGVGKTVVGGLIVSCKVVLMWDLLRSSLWVEGKINSSSLLSPFCAKSSRDDTSAYNPTICSAT